MALWEFSRLLLLSVSQLLPHHWVVFGGRKEGWKERRRRTSAHSLCTDGACVLKEGRGEKGEWFLFENSNQPITLGGCRREETEDDRL